LKKQTTEINTNASIGLENFNSIFIIHAIAIGLSILIQTALILTKRYKLGSLLNLKLTKLKEFVLVIIFSRASTVKPAEESVSNKNKENKEKYANYKSILKDDSLKINASYDEYKKYIESL
jgi:hypothetical protein